VDKKIGRKPRVRKSRKGYSQDIMCLVMAYRGLRVSEEARI